ncbi:MAG: 3-oxoadipate enol-lactonase [Pseudomonadota bacterium]
MQTFPRPFGHLHYRDDGDPAGMPLVFANSLGTDLRLWDDLLPRLPAGLRLVRFDKRGHGLSSVPPGPYSAEDLAGDAAALLDALGIRSCVFVGLSIGGLIAQCLATSRPDLVSALVLSNTAARLGSTELWQARIADIKAHGLAGIADDVMERWFAPAFRQTAAYPAWRQMLINTPQAGYVGCCHALAAADQRAATARLTLPTLGIAGSVDGSTPVAVVCDTVESIPGARVEVIEGTGHLPCVEAPDRYAALLTTFLADLGPA